LTGIKKSHHPKWTKEDQTTTKTKWKNTLKTPTLVLSKLFRQAYRTGNIIRPFNNKQKL